MLRRNPRADAWLHAASLAATAWFVWVNSVAPRLGRMPLAVILSQAAGFLAIACAGAILLALLAYITVSRGGGQGPIRRPQQALAVAVWYAPAMFLAASFTPASMAGSLLLVVSATVLLCTRWLAGAPRETFAFTPGRVLAWRMLMAGIASAAIHGGVFAYGAMQPMFAAACFAASAAILTALTIVTGAVTPRRTIDLPHAALAAVLTLLLAAGITMVRYGSGFVSAVESETAGAAKADDGFPGVILDAGRRTAKALIEPPDVALAPRSLDFSEPVSIPFTGEYWLFRPPFRRPPALSFHRDGTPADVWFTTTDGGPLAMEAEQVLAEPIPGDCCSRIDVVVSGRPLPPNVAFLQLQLLDSKWSRFSWYRFDKRPLAGSGSETVSFALPATTPRKFDRLKVVFHPPAPLASESMRIKIERFVLVPR